MSQVLIQLDITWSIVSELPCKRQIWLVFISIPDKTIINFHSFQTLSKKYSNVIINISNVIITKLITPEVMFKWFSFYKFFINKHRYDKIIQNTWVYISFTLKKKFRCSYQQIYTTLIWNIAAKFTRKFWMTRLT